MAREMSAALDDLCDRLVEHERSDEARQVEILRRMDTAQAASEARHSALVDLLSRELTAARATTERALGLVEGRETRASDRWAKFLGTAGPPLAAAITAAIAYWAGGGMAAPPRAAPPPVPVPVEQSTTIEEAP